MKNHYKYGYPPFRNILLHGGPGAAKQLAPVAKVISTEVSVIEAIQTKNSIKGQIAELFNLTEKNCDYPINLIGHSWGAWLACLFAVKFPDKVKKLVLIGTPPFSEPGINLTEVRLQRLAGDDRTTAEKLLVMLNNPANREITSNQFSVLRKLLEKADTFAQIETEDEDINVNPEIFHGVWQEAAKLRSSGELLNITSSLECPITVIHGDYDPHPYSNIQETFAVTGKNPKFYLLEKCGHYPWKEKYASDYFFLILKDELI